MITDWKAVLGSSYSAWAFYLIIGLQGALGALASISPENEVGLKVQLISVAALGFIGVIGRIIDQPGLETDNAEL